MRSVVAVALVVGELMTAGTIPCAQASPPQGVFYASWNQYQGFPAVLLPASQGICFLQGVTGNFRGGGEGVWVRNNGTKWVLDGISRQQNVSARAMCVPFAAIQGADRGFNYAIGTGYVSVYYGGCSWWESCSGSSSSESVWGSDGFCYLTGMSGAFNGGGEVVTVSAWVRATAGILGPLRKPRVPPLRPKLVV
jgi:hypothetical protein